MGSAEASASGWKGKLGHELIEYGFNVAYLTLVFAAFFIYRRLLLASYDIAYTNYGVALIEALILGKVIMIGGMLHIGRGLEDKPLILPTIYKTVVFTVIVGIVKVGEHAIAGVWHSGGIAAGVVEFAAKGPHEIIANSLVVFVAFLPFFGIKELGRVFGQERISALFFRSRASASPGPQAAP
jgi:hypothetical protein